jgi:hypothetical protein
MRTFKVLLVLSALALTATAAWSGEMSFGLTGGMALPFGNYGDAVNTGWDGGAYGDMWMSPTTAFGADIIGNFHGGKDDVFGPGSDVNASIIQFGVHGIWKPAMQSNLHPWLQYGGGLYNLRQSGDAPLGVGGAMVSVDDTQNKFGLNGGVGLGLWSNSSMNLGVSGMYHHIFTDNEATSYMNVGLNLTFLTKGTTMAGGQ